MKRYIITLIVLLSLASCTKHSEHWETLTQMETIIEERPDSVLNVLQATDIDKLIGDEERAKHAVLLSMALDKNVIDKTDFEVLQPAIDYYDDNGTATDKLRTRFYQGRIYQNTGNDAAALECFVKAISEGSESDDILTKARIYFNRGSIYYSLYEWDNFIEANKKAAACFQEAGVSNSYTNCIIRIINGYTLKEDSENALQYIDECKRQLGTMSANRLTDFYSSYLTYLIKNGSKQDIDSTINEYINAVPVTRIDWLTISNAYIQIEQFDNALDAVSRYNENPDVTESLKYQALISEIYEHLGRYQEALDAYHKYMLASDSLDYAIIRQDTKFVEERHNLELQTLKEKESKMRVILWSALFIAIVPS